MARKKATKKSDPAKTTAKKPARGRGTKKRGVAKNQDFASAASSLDGAWGKSKTSAPTARAFGPNTSVPDGNYVARISGAKTGVPRSGGAPYFRINYTITLGELNGEKISSYDEVSDVEAYEGMTRLDLLSNRLQLCGIETSKIKSLKELPAVAAQMTKVANYLHIGVKNDYISAEESNDGKAHHFQKVFVNEVIAEDEIEDVLSEL
jgi:hypothetical protein